jgi:hypothetical protein
MALLGTGCLRASFAAMRGRSGDAEHSVLHSTTTSCRTGTVLAPTPFTINCACFDVARTLFFISVAMRTIKATFVAVDKAEFTSLQATTAAGGALSPSTPLSTDVFLGRFVSGFLDRWGGVEGAFAPLPRCLSRLVARLRAHRLIRIVHGIAVVLLDAHFL